MDDDRDMIDMTVEITDIDESAEKTELARYNAEADERAEQRPRPSSAMPMAFRNLLLELVIGIPFFLCCERGDNGAALIIGGLVLAAGHTAFSTLVYGHYKRLCGVAEWKYVLLNVLPLIAFAVLAFAAGVISVNFDIDFFPYFSAYFFSIFSAMYAMLYCALLSLVLGIRHGISGQ